MPKTTNPAADFDEFVKKERTRCSLGRLLDQLADEDPARREALVTALDTDASTLSTSSIHKVLTHKWGHQVGVQTVQIHRSKQCVCK